MSASNTVIFSVFVVGLPAFEVSIVSVHSTPYDAIL